MIKEIINRMKNGNAVNDHILLNTKEHKLIGELVEVIEEINPNKSTGKVLLKESWWMAVCNDEKTTIKEGEKARIKKVKGYLLVVSKE